MLVYLTKPHYSNSLFSNFGGVISFKSDFVKFNVILNKPVDNLTKTVANTTAKAISKTAIDVSKERYCFGQHHPFAVIYNSNHIKSQRYNNLAHSFNLDYSAIAICFINSKQLATYSHIIANKRFYTFLTAFILSFITINIFVSIFTFLSFSIKRSLKQKFSPVINFYIY